MTPALARPSPLHTSCCPKGRPQGSSGFRSSAKRCTGVWDDLVHESNTEQYEAQADDFGSTFSQHYRG
jgi:hypothetical protein